MRDIQSIAAQALDALASAGASKSECTVYESRMTEFNLQRDRINFLRTTSNATLSMRAIADARQGRQTLNQLDGGSIAQAARDAVDAARASQADPDYDISPAGPTASFDRGDAEPDLDMLHDRFRAFYDAVRERYPQITFDSTMASFSHRRCLLVNSNGVSLADRRGVYEFSMMILAKDGARVASFNGLGLSDWRFDAPLMERVQIRSMLEEEIAHLDPRPLEGKFVGDVVLIPDAVGDVLLGSLAYGMLGDGGLIAGTSPLKDRLGERIAAPALTLRSMPAGMAAGVSFTDDGYVAEDATLIDAGVLRGFTLSQYGAAKTGKARGANRGGGFVVDAGDVALSDLIGGVERGVLLCRFSGGAPSDNGDISGVAKNSFLIENGRIGQALSETMISGNQLDMLRNITGISRERVDSGGYVLPWLRCAGVTISGR